MRLEKCRISPGVWFGSKRVSIGANTFINYGCMFNTSAPVSIGRNCDVGMGVLFVTSTHELGDPQKRAGRALVKPVSIGDGVWIGARAVILPGVRIASGSVIAAGAIVTDDIEANAMYAGTPARKIRDLDG
ncbi:acyltransferase [Rhodococcus sp. NPDC057529]|uniref:acyltransferase n=1 Tax=Rhodococcus sp. NPDC057529 TaxID=3346158 RepID=UPI00366B45CB